MTPRLKIIELYAVADEDTEYTNIYTDYKNALSEAGSHARVLQGFGIVNASNEMPSRARDIYFSLEEALEEAWTLSKLGEL